MVQGVVTGVGFLCAGVIMKDGLSIRGLTTAASIWAVSAIGILLGIGLLSFSAVAGGVVLPRCRCCSGSKPKLPGRSTLDVCADLRRRRPAAFDELAEQAETRGYRVLRDSLRITFSERQPVWRFCVVALDRARAASPALLAQEMAVSDGVASFSIVPVRN